MAVLDTLDIKISANAMNAAKALDQLANAMKRVRAALLNTKDGVTVGDQLSKSIHELNNAMNRINTSGIQKLNQLSSALHKFASAAKSLKGINIGQNVSKSIQNTQAALTTQAGTATSAGGSADVDVAAENIKDVGDETETAGKKAKKAAGFFKKLWDSIKRIAFYRAIRSAMKAISEAFSEGLKNAYHYSKQSETFQRLADTLDRLKSSSAQMVNQLGAFWGEFKQLIQPAVLWLIEKVRKLSEWLTELFAALNGEKTYLQAQYVAKEWDEATDNVKKYKQQLLGLDELNNLTSQNKSDKEEVDYSKLYKEVSVSQGLLKVGEAWGALKGMIVESLAEIELALGGFMVGVGAALLFSGANIPLGLGLILAGGFMTGKAVKEQWGLMQGNLEETLTNIESILGGFMAGIGAVLLFSGTAPQWGLGLIIAGIGLFSAAKKRKTDWSKIDKKTQDTLTLINLTLGGFLGVIGAVLLFSGANIPLGIGCLVAGIATISSNAKKAKSLDWGGIGRTVREKLVEFFGPGGLIAFGAGMLAIGAVLAFSSANIPLGIALMVAGGASLTLGMTQIDWRSVGTTIRSTLVNLFGPGGLIAFGGGLLAIGALLAFSGANIPLGIAMLVAGSGSLALGLFSIDWDGVLRSLKTAWAGIANWWNGTVKPKIQGAADWVKSQFETVGDTVKKRITEGIEKITEKKNPKETTVTTPITGVEIQLDPTVPILEGLESLSNDKRSPWEKIVDLWNGIFPKAQGGVIKPIDNGSLFYAGEAGPEFVGAMGNSSAVANTGQMTDAIYKAAYMGMSRALQENGGSNGLAGFVPATTDDLFIAMRKKASNYNKMTGSSAFA